MQTSHGTSPAASDAQPCTAGPSFAGQVIVAVEQYENGTATALHARQLNGLHHAILRSQMIATPPDWPAQAHLPRLRPFQQTAEQYRESRNLRVTLDNRLDHHGRSSPWSAFDRSSSPALNEWFFIAFSTDRETGPIHVSPFFQLTMRKCRSPIQLASRTSGLCVVTTTCDRRCACHSTSKTTPSAPGCTEASGSSTTSTEGADVGKPPSATPIHVAYHPTCRTPETSPCRHPGVE